MAATPRISFEFFPPKASTSLPAFWRTVRRLSAYTPAFMSLTYGAGGSGRDRTVPLAGSLQAQTGIPVAGHLTCVGESRDATDGIARTWWARGIRRIVALRGDPPEGGVFQPHPDGYDGSIALVAGLRQVAPFEIAVGAYPEVHPQAASAEDDLTHLKRKLDAGADIAITQFFFEADTYLRFRDRAVAAGIDQPIIPGILPIANFGKTVRFADACGAKIPDWLRTRFDGLDAQPEARADAALETAEQLCQSLRHAGVDQFHLYTLNGGTLSARLCDRLGLEATSRPADAA